MLEWLKQSSFLDPADVAMQVPRASLRLNHVESVTERYLSDPAFDPDAKDVPESVRAVAKNRMRLDQQRQKIIQERAREQVELRFGPFTYTIRVGGTVRIVAYSGAAHYVEIPQRICGNEVTALDGLLFAGHDEIEAVSIPDTVEVLGHRLFEKCMNLKSVRLPRELKQVGAGVFAGCGSIRWVQVNSPEVCIEVKLLSGASVEELSLGPCVQHLDISGLNMKKLERVSVDPGNKTLTSDGLAVLSKDGSELMRLIVPVKRYVVPEGCLRIAHRAFDSMENLAEVVLPSGLKSIGRLAFAKTSLSRVHLPSGLELVDEKAFFFCTKLSEAFLPSSVRFLGAGAFARSGVKKVTLPALLEHLGHGAFDETPAQREALCGSIAVDEVFAIEAGKAGVLRIDDCAGIYLDDTFLELVGQVTHYKIASGTHSIASGACKRHRTLRRIEVSQGVCEIGAEAFCGCSQLCVVDLPESLLVIGARAFMDTSVRTLRISANVRELGENALLVQGDNPLAASASLDCLDLDPANLRFYLQNGLLCKRSACQEEGDTVLLYVGPNNIVHIPNAVTRIGAMAFCGAAGVDELYLHDHIKSICTGALSTKRTVDVLHLSFAHKVDGAREACLAMPEYTSRYRSMMPLFETTDKETGFNFDYYDTWVACSTTISEFAPAAFARLKNPVRLCKRCRELYQGTFTRKAQAVVSFFAERADLDALIQLKEWGFIDMRHVQRELDVSLGSGSAQKTACLFELRRRMAEQSTNIVDFSL